MGILAERSFLGKKLKNDELIRQLNGLWKSLSGELQMRKDYQLSHKLSVLNMKEGVYDFLNCSGAKPKNRKGWLIYQKYMLFHNQDIKLKKELLVGKEKY